MSEQPNPKDYYADTAYKPAKRVAWEEANPDRQRISGSRLTWYRRTPDNGTKDEYGYENIAISKNWENEIKRSPGSNHDVFKKIGVFYTHHCIIPPNFSSLSRFLFLVMGVGKGGFYLCLWVTFLISFSFLVMSVFSGAFAENLSNIAGLIVFLSPIAFVLLLAWQLGRFLEKKFPRFFYKMQKTPLWQLNRQNGFFTIYNPKRAWEERLVAPIYEFDAYLESSPDTQGSPTYSLMLFHPETGLRQKLDAQFPPTNIPGELVAAWQFIQRYMDVSQPLPDVPALEIHRHKDPTTAAADQRKGRNPRYWRDMSEAEVEKIQEEKYQKNIRLR